MSYVVTLNKKAGNGSASPIAFGTYNVNIGDTFYTILTADTGYIIDQVVVNGTSFSVSQPTYALSFAIFQNTTIDVYFISSTPPPPPPPTIVPYIILLAGVGMGLAFFYMRKGLR